MRFVAKYKNFTHGVRKGRHMILADGQRQELTRDLICVFQPAASLLTEEEIKFGIDNLNHTGLPIDKNTNQHFSPRSRLSGYDTVLAAEANEWTPEELALVEKTLMESPDNGRDFMQLAEAPVEKPWSTYDTISGEKIIPLAKEMGLSLERVLAYEKANRNDAGLVFLLERELAAPVEEANDAAVVIEA